MSPKKVSVFEYTDYRQYLEDYYNYQKENSSHFSYRYFAQAAGFSSHNVLKLVIRGERNVAQKSIHKYIKALKMSEREAEYFKILVLFNQSSNEEDKRQYLEQLFRFQEGAKTRRLSELQYHLYTEWYHAPIRELVSCGIQDPKEIARRLDPAIGGKKAQESLDLLSELELIETNENGDLILKDKTIETAPELNSFIVREHNRSMVGLAQRSIREIDKNRREVSGMTLGISHRRFELMKSKIQKFKEELLQDVITDEEESELVYQLNFQLFPLINEGKKI